MIFTVSMATESPQKDLLINTNHVSRQLILAEILSRSIDNYHVTVYQITDISETTMINALVLGLHHNTQNEPRATSRQLILVEI